MFGEKILDHNVEELLSQFIREKRKTKDLSTAYPNPLIREDVLSLLDRYCTVIYFPLKNEANNGFHVTDMPFLDGEIQNFVFINTAQTTEKQVFTAAHELGHVWNVDDYILDCRNDLEDSEEIREQIINRFAAVLLMPENIFSLSVYEEVKNLSNGDQTISLNNIFKMIVNLMNQFFVPMKAVVIRLQELDFIPPVSANILLGHGSIPETDITLAIQKVISDCGYVKFKQPTMKKWIEGLPELLNRAEESGTVPQAKIDFMRNKFDLNDTHEFPTELNGVSSLSLNERPEE